MNNVVKKAIANFLDAVEKAHGPDARRHTFVEQRIGTDLVIRQGGKSPQVINLAILRGLTSMLRTPA